MLIRHSLSYLLARGVPGIVNFLAIIIYTRLLSPEEYGRYALVLSSIDLANVVCFQWLRLSFFRFLPMHERQPVQLIATVLLAFLLVACLTSVLGLGLAYLWPAHAWRPLILFGIVLLWLQAWFDLNLELQRIQLKPMQYGLLTVVKVFPALLVGITLALWGLGAQAPLLGLGFGLFAAGVMGLRERIWWVKPAIDAARLRELLRYGVPLTATFALGYVVNSSDRFLLAKFLGEAEVGLYAAAYDIAQQSLILLMSIIHSAAYPLAVRALEAQGMAAADMQLRKNAVMLLVLSLPACLGIIALAPNIAQVLFGTHFQITAAALLPLVAFAAFIAGIKAFYFDLAFQLGQSTLVYVWVMVAAAASNFILNLWWIPMFGLAGAAWATVAAYCMGLLFSVLLGRRVFKLSFPWKEALQLLLASLAMFAVLLPFRYSTGVLLLVYCIIGGALVFAALVLALDIAHSRARLATHVRRRLKWNG